MRIDTSSIDPTDYALARRVSVGDITTRSAATFHDRTAVTDPEGAWTYGELEGTANRLAHGLVDLGLDEEEPVAILSVNCREFVASYFAIAKAGMVAVPINLLSGQENIVHALVDSGTRVVIVHSSLLELALGAVSAIPEVEQVIVIGGDAPVADPGDRGSGRPAVIPWDDALSADDSNPETLISDRQIVQCLYSSGTTSRPKGVLTSHLSVSFAGLNNAAIFGLRWGAEGSVSTLPLPLFHTAGLNGGLISTLSMGATVHLLPGFEPEQYARVVAETRSTHIIGLPLMLEALIAGAEAGHDYSALETALYAMAPMSQTTLEKITEALPNAKVILGSGMTECTPATVMQWPELNPEKTASWGYPVPSTENKILEPGGTAVLPTGTEGEISYRGPVVMEGYFNNPEANAAVFAGGYMHSGDLGRFDEQGVLWFSDRVKDIVKSGGENVSSLDLERQLAEHPGIAEVAVIGRPDEKWGEQVVAVVVPAEDGADEEALEASINEFSASRFTSSQRPRSIEFVSEIPRTATGKIRKVQLRAEV